MVPCPSSLSEPSAHTDTSVSHSTDSRLSEEFSRSSHQQRGIAPVSQHSSPSSLQSKVSSPEPDATQESSNQAPSSLSEALQNGCGHDLASESGTLTSAGTSPEETSSANDSGCMAVVVLGLQGQNLDLERYFHNYVLHGCRCVMDVQTHVLNSRLTAHRVRGWLIVMGCQQHSEHQNKHLILIIRPWSSTS